MRLRLGDFEGSAMHAIRDLPLMTQRKPSIPSFSFSEGLSTQGHSAQKADSAYTPSSLSSRTSRSISSSVSFG